MNTISIEGMGKLKIGSVKQAKSQTRTYAKQPALAFALAHKSHTFGRAPWLAS